MLWGETADRLLFYSVGVFNGEARTARTRQRCRGEVESSAKGALGSLTEARSLSVPEKLSSPCVARPGYVMGRTVFGRS